MNADTPVDHDVARPSTLPQAVDRKGRASSSWIVKERWNLWEFICSLDLGPPEIYFEKDKDFDRGPPPVHPMWKENAMILTVGMLPIWLQWASMKLFPSLTWSPWAAYLVYHLLFIHWAWFCVTHLHSYMKTYGVFDENVRGRDLVSDKSRNKLGSSILLYMILRTAAPFIMAYDRNVLPTFSLYSPFKIMAWQISLDFFFYCYHRACHEVPWLWHVHRAHHGTKHPTPILSILADDIQEVIEVICVPLLATCVVPLRFHESWAAIVYLLYVEMLGHSGIRAHWQHPLLAWPLKPFGMDLGIEDHDLHHRLGRGGKNYGKQTRIWDRLFGTISERIDTAGY